MAVNNLPKLTKASSLSAWERKQKLMAQLNATKAKKIILYKDDDIIAINKPSGLTVQGGTKNDDGLLSYIRYWQFDKPRPPGLAHRIDKNTTGVLLLTRTKEGARKMKECFENRTITKKYWAIAIGVPQKPQGSITIPLGVKNVSTTKSRSLHRVILRTDKIEEFTEEKAGTRLHGRDICLAWTKYNVISQYHQQCSLLDIQLITGFKHQIRAHLADALNTPVLGDYLFAGPLFRKDTALVRKMEHIGERRGYIRGPIYLHAYEVTIPREGRDPLVIRAPLPDYFGETLNALQLKLPSEYESLMKVKKERQTLDEIVETNNN